MNKCYNYTYDHDTFGQGVKVCVFDLFMLYEFRLSMIRMLNVHYVLVHIRPDGNIPRIWPLKKLNNQSIIVFICLHCLRLTKLMKAYSVDTFLYFIDFLLWLPARVGVRRRYYHTVELMLSA